MVKILIFNILYFRIIIEFRLKKFHADRYRWLLLHYVGLYSSRYRVGGNLVLRNLGKRREDLQGDLGQVPKGITGCRRTVQSSDPKALYPRLEGKTADGAGHALLSKFGKEVGGHPGPQTTGIAKVCFC